MIIWLRNEGTQTETFYSNKDDTSAYYENETYSPRPLRWTVKEWIILQNAIKAFNTLFELSKAYSTKLFVVYVKNIYKIRQLMFSKSGYLPKRIKRKRKGVN